MSSIADCQLPISDWSPALVDHRSQSKTKGSKANHQLAIGNVTHPVASTTPAGRPGWGPRSAPGSVKDVAATRMASGLRSAFDGNHPVIDRIPFRHRDGLFRFPVAHVEGVGNDPGAGLQFTPEFWAEFQIHRGQEI